MKRSLSTLTIACLLAFSCLFSVFAFADTADADAVHDAPILDPIAAEDVYETDDSVVMAMDALRVTEAGTELRLTDSAAGKRIYFAAPLFSQAELEYNLKLTKVLEDHGYEVFLPQRDGYLAAELEGKTEEELTQMIFEKDVGEVLKADIVFVLLDGRVPDEGACVELGIAYANDKRCYGFKTDSRSVEKNLDLNPMIGGCFIKIFSDINGDHLIADLEHYLSENEL